MRHSLFGIDGADDGGAGGCTARLEGASGSSGWRSCGPGGRLLGLGAEVLRVRGVIRREPRIPYPFDVRFSRTTAPVGLLRAEGSLSGFRKRICRSFRGLLALRWLNEEKGAEGGGGWDCFAPMAVGFSAFRAYFGIGHLSWCSILRL